MGRMWEMEQRDLGLWMSAELEQSRETLGGKEERNMKDTFTY